MPSHSPRSRVALAGPLLILAIAGYAGYQSLQYGLWTPAGPGSGLLPLICSVLLAGLAIADLPQRMARKTNPAVAGDASPVLWWRVGTYAAALVGFVAAMDYLGFVASGILALAAAVRLGEGKGWARALCVSGASVALAWLLFARMLSVNLPAGRWLALF